MVHQWLKNPNTWSSTLQGLSIGTQNGLHKGTSGTNEPPFEGAGSSQDSRGNGILATHVGAAQDVQPKPSAQSRPSGSEQFESRYCPSILNIYGLCQYWTRVSFWCSFRTSKKGYHQKKNGPSTRTFFLSVEKTGSKQSFYIVQAIRATQTLLILFSMAVSL